MKAANEVGVTTLYYLIKCGFLLYMHDYMIRYKKISMRWYEIISLVYAEICNLLQAFLWQITTTTRFIIYLKFLFCNNHNKNKIKESVIF